MRLPNPTGEKCQETTGFLFKHACAGPAVYRCDQCQKLNCEQHSVLEGTSTYCTSCYRKISQSGQRQNSPSQFDDDRYSPYWYSGTYYHGYGYYGTGYWGNSYVSGGGGRPTQATADSRRDPNDFTESDTSAVQAEGDANFEQEIGGS